MNHLNKINLGDLIATSIVIIFFLLIFFAIFLLFKLTRNKIQKSNK